MNIKHFSIRYLSKSYLQSFSTLCVCGNEIYNDRKRWCVKKEQEKRLEIENYLKLSLI